jgi:hypothetical protein
MKLFNLKGISTFAINYFRPSLIAAGCQDPENSIFLGIYDVRGKLLNSVACDQDFYKISWSQTKDYNIYSRGLIAATHNDGRLSLYNPDAMFDFKIYFVIYIRLTNGEKTLLDSLKSDSSFTEMNFNYQIPFQLVAANKNDVYNLLYILLMFSYKFLI